MRVTWKWVIPPWLRRRNGCGSARSAGDSTITDQARYNDMCRSASTYKKITSGKPTIPNWVAAAIHFNNPSNYFRNRFESESKALLASGYFVETEVPVSDLRARLAEVSINLSKTALLTGSYYEAKLDWPRDRVHLICRKQDLSGWEKALGRPVSQ
jgi:hypothetical protein